VARGPSATGHQGTGHRAILKIGERLGLKIAAGVEGSAGVRRCPLISISRSKENAGGFLSSIYCHLQGQGRSCTGSSTMLACNPNGCGMPNAMKKEHCAED